MYLVIIKRRKGNIGLQRIMINVYAILKCMYNQNMIIVNGRARISRTRTLHHHYSQNPLSLIYDLERRNERVR